MMGEKVEKVVEELGDDSVFFDKVDDLSYDELGEYRGEIRLGIETWIEEYDNGYIVYHLGNGRYIGVVERRSRPLGY